MLSKVAGQRHMDVQSVGVRPLRHKISLKAYFPLDLGPDDVFAYSEFIGGFPGNSHRCLDQIPFKPGSFP
jgi:hypothetical protein